MLKSKNFLVGVLVGVIVVLAVQWGFDAYKEKKIVESFKEFTLGYKNAADKEAYVNGFTLARVAPEVTLNTSNANDAEGCKELYSQYEGIIEFRSAMERSWANGTFQGGEEGFSKLWELTDRKVDSLRDELMAAGCGGEMEVSY